MTIHSRFAERIAKQVVRINRVKGKPAALEYCRYITDPLPVEDQRTIRNFVALNKHTTKL